MKENLSKITRIVSREGIYMLSKKEYCILNNFERLSPPRKLEAIASYKEAGIAMVDLGGKVVFFALGDSRFKVN